MREGNGAVGVKHQRVLHGYSLLPAQTQTGSHPDT